MRLGERLHAGTTQPPPPLEDVSGPTPSLYQDVKAKLHNQLIDKVDLRKLERLAPADAHGQLREVLAGLMAEAELPLNRLEHDRMLQEVLDEVTGLGPLEPLLADRTLSDILVNGHGTVYVEREGVLHEVGVRFRDDDHLLQIINRIVSRVGRRIDETSPMVDARLPDGSRVNAIIPPLAIDGPVLSIRRFGADPLTAADLIARGTFDEDLLRFLAAAVRSKLNLIVSGGTGTGKTTLLNVLSSYIPDGERVITIEDAAELQLQQRHVVRLETRPPNVEGAGAVVQRDLVRNSLRMRPDRIIVGEVRGAEVLDMLQAMNTGHEGSMTTVHANSPRDAMNRLMAMAAMANSTYNDRLLLQTVARTIELVIHVHRFPDGRRRIVSVTEVIGTEGDMLSMQELVVFDHRGVDADGHVLGAARFTGVRPRCLEKMQRAGVSIEGGAV